MAKRTKTVVSVVDDLDGTELGDDYETIRWSLDGRNYEFDTSAANAQEFRDLVDRYVKASRSAGRPTRRRSSPNTPAIRSWAQANGFSVSDRGRIPADVIAAYEAAH
ncbi:MAG: Lsr2 family protein [Gordonia sp. (in: high G+C Gram-positive bacteria)]|uniref:histone-like nucleoid-structuring protein Lsr2 n=1 Tax=Gordonia sp. (in: high G+C Gram-positive bacteria) TaxID=84139 RepID=UPI0039E40628